ncbi:cardiolipin synthase [Rhodobacteraceae bacterium N5(2021)]|uniref:Cardiolipin synthase n=1 Tax=Gymnodinialimonas phycosphaerae TaxID=2841589 RepID=A0A975TYU2_9RHOB|nr:cardiolipin synthase [Gymnodinialimonas phycosphaerae]MBY4892504.1 cardiolipin synthase [Gymnodinialimonas phycosphaerae]
MSAPLILQLLIGSYLLSVVAFIISENRTPKSTFAWMLVFALLPLVGLGIYLFLGRGHKAFVRKFKITEQGVPNEMAVLFARIQTEHNDSLASFKKTNPTALRIAKLLHSNSNSMVTTSNKLAVLQNADLAYPAMVAAMEQANHSIHLHYYSWNADSFGDRVLNLLTKKVAQGVEVRILYDPIGSFTLLSRRYLRQARAAGIQIMPFSSLWRIHTISYRNHRKIAVIDGAVGFTGGLNIGDEHIAPPAGFDRWRDTHIQVEGSAVWALQSIFLVDWMNATDEELDPTPYFSDHSDKTNDAFMPVQICLSGPDSEYEAIRQLYFEMITTAEHQVLIQSPFLILDETISEALKMKALSGVDVQVMISSSGPGQFLPYWAANTFAAEIAQAGVDVQMYEAGYLHAKTICVDGKICSIGSANWDIRSFSINYELTAVIYDEAVSAKLVSAFLEDLNGCMPFDVDAYAARPRLLRFKDSMARLASPLL